MPRLPVKGTIARGFTGSGIAKDAGALRPNGSVPYYYGDTEDERTGLLWKIFAIHILLLRKDFARGKKLFDVTCAICSWYQW
jgi:hypothetical protein